MKQQVGDWSLVARALHRDIPRFSMDAFVKPNTGVDPATLTAPYVNRKSDGGNGKTALDAYATGPFTLFGREPALTVGYSFDKRTISFLNRARTDVGRYSILNPEAIPLLAAAYTSGSETDLRQSGFHSQLRLRPLSPRTIAWRPDQRLYQQEPRHRAVAGDRLRPGAYEHGQFTPIVGAVLYAPGMRLLELQRQRRMESGERDLASAQQAKNQADAARFGQQLSQSSSQAQQVALDALAKAQNEVIQRREEVTKARRASHLQRLIAPVGGTVQQLAVHMVGGVVEPVRPFMMIVPEGEPSVEARVMNRDAGFVHAMGVQPA